MDEQTTQQTSQPAHDCIFPKIADGFKQAVRDIGPSEPVLKHFRNARMEVLKGIRAMIDSRIDRLSRDPQTNKGTVVVVE
jgi:hypothetical protein